jgi:ATP-dependent helicase YprA (DUF1998 family)
MSISLEAKGRVSPTDDKVTVLNAEAFLRATFPQYVDQLRHCEVIKGRPAVFGDLTPPNTLPDALWTALHAKGVERLFRHQAVAIDAALAVMTVGRSRDEMRS